MRNKLVLNSLSVLKNASRARHTFVDVRFNKIFFRILMILYTKGYILGFTYNNFKTIRVFLKYYKDKGLLDCIAFPSNIQIFFSFKALAYLRKYYKYENIMYIFSTSKGLLSLEEIFFKNLNIGGILYFYIIYN